MLATISTVGVFGSYRFIRFRSALVTRLGVIGTTGENGWYGEYGTGAPVHGVCAPEGDSGCARSNTVCLVWLCVAYDGDASDGSYARSGRLPPVRTADGALERNDVARGDAGRVWKGCWNEDARGDAGSVGKRLTPGLGDDGRPTRGADESAETAESGSSGACALLLACRLVVTIELPMRSSMLSVLSGDISGVIGAPAGCTLCTLCTWDCIDCIDWRGWMRRWSKEGTGGGADGA